MQEVQKSEAFKNYGLAFLEAFEAIEQTTRTCASLCTPTRLSITMITFTASLSSVLTQEILRDLAENLGDCSFFTYPNTKTLAPGFKSIILRGRMGASTTQVFHLGKVQIAGCGSHVEAAGVLDELVALLREYTGLERLYVTSLDTQLINFNCALGIKVSLCNEFVDLMNTYLAPLKANRRAEKRENYAPVSIYLESIVSGGRVSSRLFSTGSLVITGRCAKDLAVAYDLILSFLVTHKTVVVERVLHHGQEDAEERNKNAKCWMELAKSVPGLMHAHLPVRHVVPTCRYCQILGNVFSSS